MIFISFVLYLRNKFDYVRFAIIDIFDKKIEVPLADVVDINMKDLFDHYVKKSSKISLFASFHLLHLRTHRIYLVWPVMTTRFFKKIMRTKLEFVTHEVVSESSSSKSELGRYLTEDVEPETDDFDILKWLKFNEPRFSILSEMTHYVLVIGISSVASECIFSTRGWILDPFGSLSTPKLVHALICVQDWYRSEPNPINVEADIKHLELL